MFKQASKQRKVHKKLVKIYIKSLYCILWEKLADLARTLRHFKISPGGNCKAAQALLVFDVHRRAIQITPQLAT